MHHRAMTPLALACLALGLGGCASGGSQARAGDPVSAPAEAGSPLDAQSLAGKWRVDLRPTPDAEPYYRTMVIESVKDGNLAGSFYGSDMERAMVNDDWAAGADGDIVFAFVTRDGSGPYHTSGVLRDGRIVGVTHSLGRGFVSRWTAERE